MVELQKNVPMPSRKRRRRDPWPWAEMQVNESFAVPVEQLATFRVQTSLAAKRYARKFTVLRTDDGGYRCWRVE